MSVSNYNPFECTYRIDKLDNVVYLIPEAALRNIKIDNGYAYVENIEYEPIYFNCYNISLEDTDTLDERYEFTHTLKFSVNGYVNHNDFQGCYYVIVKSVDNEYWLVNPLFPCKITYTYTLSYQDNHTDFTLSTVSNHPTLRIHNMNQGRAYPCNGYLLNSFDRLFLNEKMFSSHSGKDVYYTNSGFKEVIYDKKSATFQEQFDGDNVSHSIQFNIKFDDYKSSWHYNLLEFQDNLYAAIITTTKGEYVLCGFGFGLQPSYTVTSDGEMTPDHIEIRLVDMHDNGNLFTFVTGSTISPNNDRVYNYTTKYDAWECVSDGYAKYLLQEEFDVLGNPTGHYKCLEGYEERFAFLGDALIGTFDAIVTFYQPQCKESGCTLSTSLPSTVKMFAEQCTRFSVKADSDWSITNNASYLQVNPTSGSGGTAYTVQLCNNRPQSAASVTTSITINYCSTAETYTVQVGKGDGCFYAGDEINISPIGQYVTIPTECCIDSALETTSALTNIQIFENYIKVYVPQNNTESARTFTLDVTLCDGTDSEVTITQTNAYTRWVKESEVCVGTQLCDFERMYSGTTLDNINTWTTVWRRNNCQESDRCAQYTTRWVETEETVCYMGRKYIVEAEQVKYSTESDWINTGNKRRGNETLDSPAECSGSTLEEWRVDTSDYICDNTTKYEMMRLYVSYDGGETWTATETTKKGVVIEYDSEDCGYVPPSGDTYYEWRIEGTQCNGFDLYNWEQKYVSSDGNTWSATGTYRYGSLIETNSSQCGYVPPIVYEYQWSATTGYVCSGTNKMTREIYQRRISGSSEPWENVVPTKERAAQPMIESASTDCGYVPPVEPMYKWVTISINQDYVCDECPMYRTLTTATTCVGVDKYELDEYQVSYDSGATWTTTATSATTLIEADSEDCGFIDIKMKVVRSGGAEDYLYCDSSSTLTSSDAQSFSNNNNIIDVYVGNCVTSIGDRFISNYLYPNMQSVTISDSVSEVGNEAFFCETYLSVVNVGSGITSWGGNVFVNSPNLWKMTWNSKVFPATVWKRSAFTSLILGDNVEEIAYDALSNTNCNTTLPNSVRTIGTSAFTNCSGNVQVGSGITSIGEEAFMNCGGLGVVYLPNITTIGVSAFKGSNVGSVVLGDSLTSIGNYTFSECRSLTSCTIGSGVTSIGKQAFYGCSGLTSINIPSGVTVINNQTFSGCTSLSSVTIPDSVTTIGEYAFSNCSGLTSIDIPSGVTKISTQAFYGCRSLTSISVNATTPPSIYYEAFGLTNNCPIYVPSGSVSAYKSSWSAYSSRIQAIPNS